jgi:hypothetical protein
MDQTFVRRFSVRHTRGFKYHLVLAIADLCVLGLVVLLCAATQHPKLLSRQNITALLSVHYSLWIDKSSYISKHFEAV